MLYYNTLFNTIEVTYLKSKRFNTDLMFLSAVVFPRYLLLLQKEVRQQKVGC